MSSLGAGITVHVREDSSVEAVQIGDWVEAVTVQVKGDGGATLSLWLSNDRAEELANKIYVELARKRAEVEVKQATSEGEA